MSDSMRRVSADLEISVLEPARVALQVAVADAPAQERLDITLDGKPVDARTIASAGGRLQVLDVGAGQLLVSYAATVTDRATTPRGDDGAALAYLRPSRYAESDRLAAVAGTEFVGIDQPHDLLAAVSSWVGTRLFYLVGSSGPTDGAVDTLLAGAGVCRDFAHLCVALLRARGVPARMASVYAPGLSPMDFHAVAEALIDGVWRVVDATLLAPRSTLVRIATGRDAADTAFVSTYGGAVTLLSTRVTASVDGMLPGDDITELVCLT